jgi:hypothetical protein
LKLQSKGRSIPYPTLDCSRTLDHLTLSSCQCKHRLWFFRPDCKIFSVLNSKVMYGVVLGYT